jgi:molybdate/tungstate transport system permease protein
LKNINKLNLIFIFFSGIVLLFIAAPLLSMYFKVNLQDYFDTVKDKEVTDSIFLTFFSSFCSTIFFGFLSIPFAYFLARKNFRGKKIVTGIIDLPVVIPHSAAGIALLGIISRDTFLGQFSEMLGFKLVGSTVAISLAMAYVSLPYLINAARDGFQAVPEKYEKVALNLGATPLQVFFKISLPLAWRSIVSGSVLMFARGMSEFGAVIMVAYHPMITPILIFERFSSFGLKYSRPVAAIFILVCLVFFIIIRYLSSRKNIINGVRDVRT